MTKLLTTFLVFLLAACFSAGEDFNPTMTVAPDPLVSGGTATITYSDPSKPSGTTITIDIDNGKRPPNTVTDTVTITLDGDGNGTATWTVPNWLAANFNAPGVNEISRPIVP